MNLLIDGGSSDKSNVAEYQIMPYLKHEGVSYLDAVVVTGLLDKQAVQEHDLFFTEFDHFASSSNTLRCFSKMRFATTSIFSSSERSIAGFS